jgi:hypothetical protein
MATKKIDQSKITTLKGVKNQYDPFKLDFLRTDENDRIWNGEFEVTDSPRRLVGVPSGDEKIKLIDYLVYRPLPKELIQWREIPNYHPDSLDMENWYAPLINYCYDGVWVDGEYYNPLFIYWLNVFVFPVPIYDKNGNPTSDFTTSHPQYSNIDRYFLDYCWKAYLNSMDVSIMGGRGTGKSYLIDCILDREYRLMPGSLTLVSSTNEETTNEAWNKIEQCMGAIEVLHKALKLKRITDSSDTKLSGEKVELPDGSSEERGHLSRFEKIIYGKNAGKTRGKRPTKQHVEEFAAFPPSHQKGSLGACKRESRGSWYVMGSIKKCQVLYSGTGGTVENDEAEGIFCQPRTHEILPTNDFEIESGFFSPTHIKRAGTWEKTGCPNITQAVIEVNKEREAAKSDITTYTGLLQEYPMTIKEVFMRKGTNIFNQDKIATQRINISMGGDKIPKPEKGFLKWDYAENGKIMGVTWDPSAIGDIEVLEHPHWLTEHALEDEKTPMANLYVAGCDSIDQGTGDSSYAKDKRTGSELAIIVKKRMLEKGYFRTTSNIYVARYVKRSEDVRTDWENALKLAYYFNAEVNIEYTKIGIVSHFRDKGFYHLLKKRPTINQQNADPNRNTTLIGTTAAGPIIDHQDQKIKSYIDDFYDTIWFPEVLEQLQDYNRQDRTKFDMVIAMGLCELSDEDLMGKNVKPPEKAAGGLQLFGYYTEYRQDGTPIKRYGVIPQKSDVAKQFDDSLKKSVNAFQEHGGVRWIDNSDPKNPQYIYD